MYYAKERGDWFVSFVHDLRSFLFLVADDLPCERKHKRVDKDRGGVGAEESEGEEKDWDQMRVCAVMISPFLGTRGHAGAPSASAASALLGYALW